MRRWGMIVTAMVLVPWVVTLFWIRANGIVAEAKTSYEFLSENLSEYEAAAAGEHGTGADEADGVGRTGIDAAGDQGPEPASGTQEGVTVGASPASRKRILIERDGIRTYMDLEIICQG